MKLKFERILKVMENYVAERDSVRVKVDEINKNGTLSTLGKNGEIAKVENGFKVYQENYYKECNKLIDSIIEIVKTENDKPLDMASLSGLFAYISASKDKCDISVLENQKDLFRGNITVLKSVYSTLESNNATTGAKKLVSDLFFNIDDVESTLRNQIDIAFTGTTSVSNSARVIVKNAYLLGCDITNNIMDEYGTNQELRRVAGLL